MIKLNLFNKLCFQRKLLLCNLRLSSTSSSSDSQRSEVNLEPTSSDENVKISRNFSNVLSYLRETGSLFATSKLELDNFLSKIESIESNGTIMEQLKDLVPEESFQNLDQWFQDRLLSNRQPLPLQSTQALLYPDMNLTNRKLSKAFIIEYISVMILSFIDYLHSNYPDSKHIFGSFRSPAPEIDKIHRSKSLEFGTRLTKFTIVIARNCNHFLLELEANHSEQELLAEKQLPELYTILCKTIEFILDYKNNDDDGTTISFGSLSTLERNDATYGYRLLLNDPGLQRLQTADLLLNIDHLLAVDDLDNSNLDDCVKEEESRLKLVSKQILHSDLKNVGNRWFDKSKQLIVLLNNDADQILGSGICFESSLVRLEQISKLIEHSVQFLARFKQPTIESDSKTLLQLHKINLLQRDREEIIKSTIDEFALKRYQSMIESNIDLEVLCFNQYGCSLIRSLNCSTDSWIQIAINLAYFNCYLRNSAKKLEKFTTRFRLESMKNDWDSIQSLNQEFFDYFNDQQSEQKLRLAIESLEFYLDLVRNSNGESQQSMDSILREYLNHIKDGTNSESTLLIESLEKDPILQRSCLFESAKLLTTPLPPPPPPSNPRLDSVLLVKGCFNNLNLEQTFRICFNLSEEKVRFVIVSNNNNNNLEEDNVDLQLFKLELKQALIQLKSVMINVEKPI